LSESVPLVPAGESSGSHWTQRIAGHGRQKQSKLTRLAQDAIVLRDGVQVTEFQDGILPWSIQNNIALVFDEYPGATPSTAW